MADLIEVPITNLPMYTYVVTDSQGREELKDGALTLFSGRLQIVPRPEKNIREIVRSSAGEALTTVSATARIDAQLLAELSNQAGRDVPLGGLVADLCFLLSFGSRRGVSFEPSSD